MRVELNDLRGRILTAAFALGYLIVAERYLILAA